MRALWLLWRRVADDWIRRRTLEATDIRECPHDGTEPMCSECIRNEVGW